MQIRLLFKVRMCILMNFKIKKSKNKKMILIIKNYKTFNLDIQNQQQITMKMNQEEYRYKKI